MDPRSSREHGHETAIAVFESPPGSHLVLRPLSIADDLRREAALRQVITSWIPRNKAAATTWLTSDKWAAMSR